MLTPHELELVLAHNRIKRVEGLPQGLSRSHTVQAVLADLSQSELDACKKATTFAELMDLVGQQKLKRERM